MSPNAALDAARDAVIAAGASRMPRWFPACAATSFALAMTLLGAGSLVEHGRGDVARWLSFAAMAAIVVHFGMYGVLVRRWRRGGVVPRVDGLVPPARRQRGFALFAAAGVIAALVWGFGQIGWAEIAFGVLAGAEYHYRLSGWRRPVGTA